METVLPGIRFRQAIACKDCTEAGKGVGAVAAVVSGITTGRNAIQYYCMECRKEVLRVDFDEPVPAAATPKVISGSIAPQPPGTATDLIAYALHCRCAGYGRHGDMRTDNFEAGLAGDGLTMLIWCRTCSRIVFKAALAKPLFENGEGARDCDKEKLARVVKETQAERS